jgi:arylsulfatase
MDAMRNADKPFFAYIPLNAAHQPHVVPEDYYRQYLGKPGVNDDTARYFGMAENIDTDFGLMLKKLKEWGIENNTLVIYIGTDNGATNGAKIFNDGMRGGKGTPYEGGTRSPMFVRWPAVIKGGEECAALCAHLDIFPTLAEITGASLSDDVKKQVEGRSLWPLFLNPQAPWADRYLYTHVGRWNPGTPPQEFHNCSIRNTRYSLVRAKNNRWELYDLHNDRGESHNIAGEHPDIVKQLSMAYDQWWQSVQPYLVNENAYKTAPKVNPFKELYWKQFGGGPDAPGRVLENGPRPQLEDDK